MECTREWSKHCLNGGSESSRDLHNGIDHERAKTLTRHFQMTRLDTHGYGCDPVAAFGGRVTNQTGLEGLSPRQTVPSYTLGSALVGRLRGPSGGTLCNEFFVLGVVGVCVTMKYKCYAYVHTYTLEDEACSRLSLRPSLFGLTRLSGGYHSLV